MTPESTILPVRIPTPEEARATLPELAAALRDAEDRAKSFVLKTVVHREHGTEWGEADLREWLRLDARRALARIAYERACWHASAGMPVVHVYNPWRKVAASLGLFDNVGYRYPDFDPMDAPDYVLLRIDNPEGGPVHNVWYRPRHQAGPDHHGHRVESGYSYDAARDRPVFPGVEVTNVKALIEGTADLAEPCPFPWDTSPHLSALLDFLRERAK